MAQLWILTADIDPLNAIATGKDQSICGDCPLRGNGHARPCYVAVRNAPTAIHAAWRRGGYPTLKPAVVAEYLRAQRLPIRFGAYGEPAALPWSVIAELADSTTHTGYTHQWRKTPVQAFQPFLMASVDSVTEQAQARAAGWRTFRTRTADDAVLPGEIMCPASDEMGHRTTCANCSLRDGSRGADDRRKQISIIVHGPTKVHYLTVIRNR